MHMLERRLQILLDDGRYRRVAAAARERKTSVAAVIRDAIDQALPVDLEQKRRAGEELLAAEPIPVPETIEELKAEIRDARGWGSVSIQRFSPMQSGPSIRIDPGTGACRARNAGVRAAARCISRRRLEACASRPLT